MRIYVAKSQQVQYRGSVVHFRGGHFYDVEEGVATAMVRDQLAETPAEYAARMDYEGQLRKQVTESVMHASGVTLAEEPEGVMHAPTERAIPPAAVIQDPDSDATGVKELVVDAGEEFLQTPAPEEDEAGA